MNPLVLESLTGIGMTDSEAVFAGSVVLVVLGVVVVVAAVGALKNIFDDFFKNLKK